MSWIVVLIYCWILFFLFIDRTRFKHTVYGGLITAALGTMVDWAGQRLELYRFDGVPVGPAGASLLYAVGPLFTMGVLFFQYLTLNRRMQAANVAAFSLAYLAVETLIVWSGGARYIHWHFLASLGVDLIVFTALSYAGEVIVFKRLALSDGRRGLK